VPDYWTHYLHGTRVLRELRFDFKSEEETGLFVLGLLGPNVFYYVPDNPEYLMLGNKRKRAFQNPKSVCLWPDMSPYP